MYLARAHKFRAMSCSSPTVAIPPKATVCCAAAKCRDGPILLQKSFCTEGQKFCRPPMRFSCKDTGGLISPR